MVRRIPLGFKVDCFKNFEEFEKDVEKLAQEKKMLVKCVSLTPRFVVVELEGIWITPEDQIDFDSRVRSLARFHFIDHHI